ncbi:MAG: hypothetical protein JXB47_15995 [Anaerolineae bacterium]|nr:hypothetical protein [Anaerolineae bacterium]
MPEFTVLESFISHVGEGDRFAYPDGDMHVHKGVYGAVYKATRHEAETVFPKRIWAIKEALAPGRYPVYRDEYNVLRTLAEATRERNQGRALSPSAALIQHVTRPEYAGLLMPFYEHTFLKELQEWLEYAYPESGRTLNPLAAERLATSQAVEYTLLLDALHAALDKVCIDRKTGDLRWYQDLEAGDRLVVLDWNLLEPRTPLGEQQELVIWGALWYEMLVGRPCRPPLEPFDDHSWQRPVAPHGPAQGVLSIGFRYILQRSQERRYMRPAELRADLQAWQSWLNRSSRDVIAIVQDAGGRDRPWEDLQDALAAHRQPLPGFDGLTRAQVRLLCWDLAWRLGPEDERADGARAVAREVVYHEAAKDLAASLPELVEAATRGRFRDVRNTLNRLRGAVTTGPERAALARWEVVLGALSGEGLDLYDERPRLVHYMEMLQQPVTQDRERWEDLRAMEVDLGILLSRSASGSEVHQALTQLYAEAQLRRLRLRLQDTEVLTRRITHLEDAVKALAALPYGEDLMEDQIDLRAALDEARREAMLDTQVQEALRALWEAAGQDAWETLPRQYAKAYAQVRHSETNAAVLRDGAQPIFWMRDFLRWAPTANPYNAVDALGGRVAGTLGSDLATAPAHAQRVEMVGRLIGRWWAAVQDAQPADATVAALAGRLVEAVYASLRRAYEAVVAAVDEARTLEALGPVHDEAVAPLQSAPVRAWWSREGSSGVPGLYARDVEDVLEAFARKYAFFAEHAPLLEKGAEGGLTLAAFIRRAAEARVELTALPPGYSLTELVEPLTAIDETVEALRRELERALQSLGRDLIRAREARATLLRIEASQALTRAWAAANAFDMPALNQALNESNRALEELDQLVTSTGPLVTEVEKLWDSYGRLRRYYDALAALPAVYGDGLKTWREQLLSDAVLEAEDRGTLLKLVKRVNEPQLADALKFLLELDARLRLERRAEGAAYAQLQAERNFYMQYDTLRKAMLRQSEAHVQSIEEGEALPPPAQEIGATLNAMWNQLPALGEAVRPLARDLVRQWGNIDAAAANLRAAGQVIAAAPGDPVRLLDALHLQAQLAAPEAFYLARAEWDIAFNAVSVRLDDLRVDAWDALEAVRDLASRKRAQGHKAFFDVSDAHDENAQERS